MQPTQAKVSSIYGSVHCPSYHEHPDELRSVRGNVAIQRHRHRHRWANLCGWAAPAKIKVVVRLINKYRASTLNQMRLHIVYRRKGWRREGGGREGATCCLPLVISYSEICFCHNFVNDSHVQILMPLMDTVSFAFVFRSLFLFSLSVYPSPWEGSGVYLSTLNVNVSRLIICILITLPDKTETELNCAEL